VGTRGTPGAALCREAGAGAQVTRGTPGAALRREVRARATGTRVFLGAALSWEPRGHVALLELPCAGRRVLEARRDMAPPELL
jgi:hypothetical protein